MIKKVIAAVLLISLFTVAIVQAVNKEEIDPEDTRPIDTEEVGLTIGAKAPDFKLETLTGDTIKLSDYKGKKVMLNFWATWCSPCKKEMPAMEQFHQEQGDEIAILAVNIDPQFDVKGFVEENNLTFTIPLDSNDIVNTAYRVINIPTTYFIDEKGIIRQIIPGAMEYNDMKKFADKL